MMCIHYVRVHHTYVYMYPTIHEITEIGQACHSGDTGLPRGLQGSSVGGFRKDQNAFGPGQLSRQAPPLLDPGLLVPASLPSLFSSRSLWVTFVSCSVHDCLTTHNVICPQLL